MNRSFSARNSHIVSAALISRSFGIVSPSERFSRVTSRAKLVSMTRSREQIVENPRFQSTRKSLISCCVHSNLISRFSALCRTVSRKSWSTSLLGPTYWTWRLVGDQFSSMFVLFSESCPSTVVYKIPAFPFGIRASPSCTRNALLGNGEVSFQYWVIEKFGETLVGATKDGTAPVSFVASGDCSMPMRAAGEVRCERDGERGENAAEGTAIKRVLSISKSRLFSGASPLSFPILRCANDRCRSAAEIEFNNLSKVSMLLWVPPEVCEAGEAVGPSASANTSSAVPSAAWPPKQIRQLALCFLATVILFYITATECWKGHKNQFCRC